MISEFTPPGTKVVAMRSLPALGLYEGHLYTVRGFVINRHGRTREPDAHILFEEISAPRGRRGEVGFPRDRFKYPETPKTARKLEMAE